MPPSDIRLVTPSDDELLEMTRGIFREYADTLGIDLRFQNFDAELVELPGEYAAPHGHLLLAFVGDQLAGCGAYRRLVDVDYANACEMKRLYVRPAFRRFGLGRMLAQSLFDEARHAGYSTILLDTLDGMEAARGLYVSLGFDEIPPYYYSPIADSHYLKADLD
ncbi:MAG: GNAT family N-acetyltransferase [Burkholderiaceae bacterium]|nr:GNAT family N-acetyltransferase [Burkholderiaceae bacterium]